MAITKNPLIRYKILDKCFRNPGKKYFIDDLIQECNKILTEMDLTPRVISRRQILDDIAFMESKQGWGIDLRRLREGKRVYYRYVDLSFSINSMPLNDVEIAQLQSAIQILSQFDGMPQFEWMKELLPKLQQGANKPTNSKTILGFEMNPFLKGLEFVSLLFNAIRYEKVLKILYQDFKSNAPYEVIIHPYFLKQYNNRWFLYGYNPDAQKYDWNLALDRIVSIDELYLKFVQNTKVNWNEYFDDLIGVTKPEGATPIQVKLVFFGETCKYVLNKPLHGSQKNKWLGKDQLQVELTVILNTEFERLLLSYSGNVKVLAPTKLRYNILSKLQESLSLYDAQSEI